MTLATITSDLADSLPVFIASARATREYRGVMPQTAEVHTLDPNTGLDWKEVTLAKLTALAITETTDLSNSAQAFSDTAQVLEPTLVGIPTVVTTRTTRKISRLAVMEMGVLSQNAMVRKNDIDGLTVIGAFTNSGPGVGATLAASFLRHMVANIRGNTTEPAPDNAPIFIVLHSFQVADIEDELTASVGTAELTQGVSAEVFANSFHGRIATAQILTDDNININSSDDASGGTFSRSALLLIRGVSPYVLTEQRPGLGGGAIAVFHYDEYVWGERLSGTTSVWGRTVTSDATAPAES